MIKLKNYQLYSHFIILSGLISIFFSIYSLKDSNAFFPIIFFIVLAITTESLSIIISSSAYISIGFAIGLAVLISFHPLTAALIMFIGTMFCIQKKDGRYNHILNSSFYKRLFNGSAYAISYLSAGYTYKFGIYLLPTVKISDFSILGIIFSVCTYVVVNTIIYMVLFSLIEEKPFKDLLISNVWVVKNLFAIAPLGILMAIAYTNYGCFGVLLFFAPLLLARYSFILYLDMRNVYFETIKALSNAIDAKDHYTNGHSYRVAHYSEVIARKMGLLNNRVDIIKTAALLHDIGKIGISDYILNKPSNLTDNEFTLIQQHPIIGSKILNDVDFLKEVSKIIKHHHEKYNGTGYPDGLRGEDITIEASILAVADAFDAMTSNRPYRNAMTFTAATNIIISEAGKQFNPIVAKVFKDIMDENREMLINVS